MVLVGADVLVIMVVLMRMCINKGKTHWNPPGLTDITTASISGISSILQGGAGQTSHSESARIADMGDMQRYTHV